MNTNNSSGDCDVYAVPLPHESFQAVGIGENNIPELPTEGWPSCFGSTKKSPNGDHYEVMLNESAGSEKGKIWKLYPPKHRTVIVELVTILKGLPPFSGDPDLVEDLDLLCEYIANKWIIEDTFTDHLTARFGFRNEHHDFWDYSRKHSKLGRNLMNGLGVAVVMITKKVGVSVPTRFSALHTRVMTEKYDDKTFAEKVAFIEEIDQDILEYLRAIYAHLSSK